jgi:halocyanin-like protein
MRRRTLLLATTGGLAALAGCSQGDGPAETATTSAGETTGATETATATPTESDDETTTAEPTPTTAESTATDTPTATPGPYDGYLDDVANFDGSPADRTGQDTVTVRVGAQGNGGTFAFSPPAVRVDPGTTVRWEWTGQGGSHSVTAEDGSFDSGLASSAGVNFERTFDSAGAAKYFCQPHRSIGMKGVVEVAGTGSGGETTTAETTDGATVTTPRTTTSDDDFY